jgi:hypothetical protein
MKTVLVKESRGEMVMSSWSGIGARVGRRTRKRIVISYCKIVFER